MIDALKQIYHYRALVLVLVLRDLKARYRGTALGFLWSFMNPLLLMTIYVLVFSVYLRMQMQNYPAFLLSGILPWTWFSSAMIESTSSILNNGGLIRKVYLPSEIFPLVVIGSHLVHFTLSIPILFCFLLFCGVPVSWSLLWLPLILLVQFIFTYSLALMLSSLAVEFRDLLQIISNVLLIWFFLTPIFYPVSAVPQEYRLLVSLNPMSYLIMAYQSIFFYNQTPSVYGLIKVAGLALALLAIGLPFFDRRRDTFAEEV